ncbi:hypothetical protein C7972_11134 [Arenibacter sp. ARW7G5Y1]|nr:hypothetical protein C7972_11134 [Arenibacter sp. ARW7G5Y1]
MGFNFYLSKLYFGHSGEVKKKAPSSAFKFVCIYNDLFHALLYQFKEFIKSWLYNDFSSSFNTV